MRARSAATCASKARRSAPYAGHPQSLKRAARQPDRQRRQVRQVGDHRVEDRPAGSRIRVRDEGPGIPEAELERVFEPFYRARGLAQPRHRRQRLGLTIARNIARAHGGDLVLRNRAEGGLEAVLTLPRRRNIRMG